MKNFYPRWQKHAVEQAIAKRGQQDGRRQFDARVKRLQSIAPTAHGGTVRAGADHDGANAERRELPGALLDPRVELARIGAQEAAHKTESAQLGSHGASGWDVWRKTKS